MNVYPMIGLVRTGPMTTPIDSPYQIIVLVVTVAMILLIGRKVFRIRKARNERSEAAQKHGKNVPGKIIAVKSQTYFDREERHAWHIQIKLNYADPKLGEITILHTLDRKIKDLPALIGSLVGITNLSSLAEKHKEFQAQRKQLESAGCTKQEIKDELMKKALEENSVHPTERDSDGYSILPKPVPVSVYVSEDRDNPENGIYVTF